MDSYTDLYSKSPEEVERVLQNIQLALNHEKKLHDTMDNLFEGLQIIDFNWRYHYVNNTVVKQSKFTREELIGFTMMEKYPGIEKTELFEKLSLCMKNRIPCHFENDFTFPDGSAGCFDLSIQPSEEGITILSNDITLRKLAEKEKNEYCQNIERLLFTMSHHLRQPVVQVLGLVNLLKSQSMNKEESEKILQFIEESVSAMDRCTREITHDLDKMKTKSKS